MIVRTQRIGFTPDRKPAPSKVKIGFEGDHLVERLEFDLPIISEHQTAMLMLDGKYANAIILQAMERDGRYYVDLTAEMIGEEGIVEAYVVMDGEEGTAWHSDTLRLQVGGVPDVNDELIEHFPDAFEQLRGEIAGHRAEMQETSEEIKAEADAAQKAAEAAENAASGMEYIRDAAEAARDDAQAAARNAESRANQAGTYSVAAETASDAAQKAQVVAQMAAENARAAHGAAEAAANNALEYSEQADAAALRASQMSAGAQGAAQRAEDAAQEVEDTLSGGSDGQLLGKVGGKAMWVDPPDGGGGDVTDDMLDAAIARHNASSGAHPDIRAAIDAIGGTGGGTGRRGTGYLRISTQPDNTEGEIEGTAYTHKVNLAAVLRDAGVAEVLLGDVLVYGDSTAYPVLYVDSSRVYLAAKRAMRGRGYLRITTQPEARTGEHNGIPYTYRIATPTVVQEAGIGDVLAGDILLYGGVAAYTAVYSGKNWTYTGDPVSVRGEKGEIGPVGPAGTDGKTPVKGTDYFTAADKAEMVAQVKAALPTLTLTGTDKNDVVHTWTLYGVEA